MEASKLAVNKTGPKEYKNCPNKFLTHMTKTIEIIFFSCITSFLFFGLDIMNCEA